jgi:hypothetical protein
LLIVFAVLLTSSAARRTPAAAPSTRRIRMSHGLGCTNGVFAEAVPSKLKRSKQVARGIRRVRSGSLSPRAQA